MSFGVIHNGCNKEVYIKNDDGFIFNVDMKSFCTAQYYESRGEQIIEFDGTDGTTCIKYLNGSLRINIQRMMKDSRFSSVQCDFKMDPSVMNKIKAMVFEANGKRKRHLSRTHLGLLHSCEECGHDLKNFTKCYQCNVLYCLHAKGEHEHDDMK